MSAWHQVPVCESEPAAFGLFHLVLDVSGSPLPQSHTCPGQYVKLSVEGVGEGFFAIASAPGTGGEFEFLIKSGSPLADALGSSKPGGQVRISEVSGRGFPMERARGKNVLLFATGSGIGAIRSAILAIARERDAFGEVTLFFGARTPDSFAYGPELDLWQQAGIRVLRTVSQPGQSGWEGLTGYVQAHLAEVKVEDAVALVVGQRKMVSDVMEALVERGMLKEAVLLNY